VANGKTVEEPTIRMESRACTTLLSVARPTTVEANAETNFLNMVLPAKDGFVVSLLTPYHIASLELRRNCLNVRGG
jgi:hypothetical protein